jgi:hypothetical protein
MSILRVSVSRSMVLSLAVVGFSSVSCRSRNESDSELMRVQFSATRAEADAKKKCDKLATLTDKNICFLNEYGTALLSRKSDHDDLSRLAEADFKKRGITQPLPLSIFSIGPKYGGTYFNSDEYPVEAENFWNDQVEPLRKQIEHVAEFLMQFHLEMDGADPIVFGIKKVELCPLPMNASKKIAYSGSTLTLGLPVQGWVSTYYGWYSWAELRKMWDRGEFFEKTYSVKSVMTSILVGDEVPLIWKVANPVGMIRNSARQFIRAKGADLVGMLGKLKASISGKNGEQNFTLMQEALKMEANREDGPFIPVVLKEAEPKVKAFFNDGQAEKFIDEWNCHANRMQGSSDISNAAVGGLIEHSDDSKVNYDLRATWVAVANFHGINVDFLTSFSNHKNFIEIPKQSIRKHEFTVKATGKVVVVTDDRINVNAAISFLKTSSERTLHSETYHEAVRTFRLPAGFRCVTAL